MFCWCTDMLALSSTQASYGVKQCGSSNTPACFNGMSLDTSACPKQYYHTHIASFFFPCIICFRKHLALYRNIMQFLFFTVLWHAHSKLTHHTCKMWGKVNFLITLAIEVKHTTCTGKKKFNNSHELGKLVDSKHGGKTMRRDGTRKTTTGTELCSMKQWGKKWPQLRKRAQALTPAEYCRSFVLNWWNLKFSATGN